MRGADLFEKFKMTPSPQCSEGLALIRVPATHNEPRIDETRSASTTGGATPLRDIHFTAFSAETKDTL
jgi:hypothetical protein